MKFPIVFSTDSNYLSPTYVAINSMLHHLSNDTEVDIYILCSGISESQKQHFYNSFHNVNFIDVEMEALHLSEELHYISIATYYRFLISEKLPEYDKCLYLDSDIIIKQDITPLLNEPIENVWLMGVRNYFSNECFPDFYSQRCRDCSIDSLDNYLNAGVLLMNLKEFRKNNLYQKMINDIRVNKYPYNDQDILNKYCNGHIALLSVKYNFMIPYLKNMKRVSDALNEDICEIVKHPTIIHYSTRKKPWKYKGYLMADCWNNEIKHIQNKEALQELICPFIKSQRSSKSIIEFIIDEIKFIWRKYIQRNFICTTQKYYT